MLEQCGSTIRIQMVSLSILVFSLTFVLLHKNIT